MKKTAKEMNALAKQRNSEISVYVLRAIEDAAGKGGFEIDVPIYRLTSGTKKGLEDLGYKLREEDSYLFINWKDV